MSDFDVGLATTADTGAIQTFIEEEWRSGHILARDEAFFRYQYQTHGDRLNMVLARRPSDGRIESVLGFIPANQSVADLWLALWKTRGSLRGVTPGVACLEHLVALFGPTTVACAGVRSNTAPLYRFLGYHVDTLRQYVLPNPDLREFRIARFPQIPARARSLVPEGQIEELADETAVIDACGAVLPLQGKPAKDVWYVRRRYLAHPTFRYRLWALRIQGQRRAVVVTRDFEARSRVAVRVVDILGDAAAVPHVTGALTDLVSQRRAEYLDLLAFGLPEAQLVASGVIVNDQRPGLVVPEYFQPFLDKNVSIMMVTSDPSGFTMFKADGDQDRPN